MLIPVQPRLSSRSREGRHANLRIVELANICARHARAAADKEVATLLSNMAKEYLAEAAKLYSDKSLHISERLRSS